MISVIVPIYNTKTYLRECVDSILRQDYQNLEVILVDDASTDGSGEICDEYGRQYEQVQVVHKENGGPGSACVAGMNAAAGDYYMFVDSDDHVEPEMLSRMAARLAGLRGEIVCCNYLQEKQKKTEPVYSHAAPGVYQNEKLVSEIKAKLIGREQRVLPLSRCMKLCEKSVFEGNEQYYDYRVRFGEDVNMMYPALINSTRVVVMEDALYYHYRYVGNSMAHGYDAGNYESLQRVTEGLRRVVSDKQVPGGEQAVDRECCYMLIHLMKNELRNPGKDYRKRIQEIYGQGQMRELVQRTRISVTERSAQLMYVGMLYPAGMLLWILRMLLKLYDRK